METASCGGPPGFDPSTAVFMDKLLFSVDSPLFAKSVSDYGKELVSMTQYLQSITRTMKAYVQQVKKISEVGEHMASKMRKGFQHAPHDANSQSITVTARAIADIISDISQSQEILALTLEQSFLDPIESICSTEVNKTMQIQQQYQVLRETNEAIMMKYIQADGHSKSINVQTLDARAYETVLQKRRFELGRYDMVYSLNKLENKKVVDVSEAFVSTWVLVRAHYNHCADRFSSSSKYLHQLNVRQQKLNDNFVEMYSKPDEQRAQLLSAMDGVISRVEAHMRVQSPNALGSSSEKISITPKSEEESSSALSRIGSLIGFGARSADGNSPRSRRSSTPVEWAGTEPAGPVVLSTIEEVEARLQALNSDFMKPFYVNDPLHELGGVIHRGYLWMKKDNPNKLTSHPWVRLWFALDETKLYCIKEGDSLNSPSEMKVVCDTMLASVRDLKDSEVPFCFEVAYANVKNFTLQAEGSHDLNSWLMAIRSAIEQRLTSSMPAPQVITKSSSSSSMEASVRAGMTASSGSGSAQVFDMSAQSSLLKSVASTASVVAVQQSRRKDMASLISSILRGNVMCAECGKDSPDWLSINLGCLICIECSGVHRSLGVHISKVRSLSLDDLEPEEYSLVTRIGNSISNSIWEAAIPRDVSKPESTAPYNTRERFIRAKYQDRSFLYSQGAPPESEATVNLKLHMACLGDDVVEASRALAYGADVNGIVGSDFMDQMDDSTELVLEEGERKRRKDLGFDGTETALHLAAKSGSLGCCVLLMLNGGDARAPASGSGKTALDHALERGFDSIHGYLGRKSDSFRPTPPISRESSSGSTSTAQLSSANAPLSSPAISSSSSQELKTLDPELLRRILF